MKGILPTPRRPIFLRALRSTLGKGSLWTLCWVLPLCLGAILAMSWVAWFGGALAGRQAPGELLASLSEPFRFDQRDSLASLRDTSATMAAALALLMMLWGAFSAGGWLQIFLERASGSNLRRFLWGGARHFGRFLRVWLLTLVLLSLVTWVMHGWVWDTLVLDFLFGAEGGDLELLDSERTVVRLAWLQSGMYAALVGCVLVWGDYTRTRLALHDTRSVLWSGFASIFVMVRYPVRTLRPCFLILLVEILVVWAFGWLSWQTNTGLGPESSWRAIVGLFLLGQIPLLWQSISRGARYHAAVQVTRWLVPPLSRPDPWGRRIGGPGGPQYPIDDSDEYGVSI